jgi:hypothetical protein
MLQSLATAELSSRPSGEAAQEQAVIARDPTMGVMLLSLPLWALRRDAGGGTGVDAAGAAQQGTAVSLSCAVVGGGLGVAGPCGRQLPHLLDAMLAGA